MTGGRYWEICFITCVQMRTLMLQLHWPYSSASTTQNYKYVCQVWMHYGVIQHHPLVALDLTATGEVPEVRKQFGCQQQQQHWPRGARFYQNHFICLLRVIADKGDAFITSLYTVYFCLLSSQCIVIFM